jgi:hypothetical protein
MTERNSRFGMNFWIDALAFISFVVCTITGYAMMEGEHMWGHLHNLAGWILVALILVHMVIHRSWISIMMSKSVRPGN